MLPLYLDKVTFVLMQDAPYLEFSYFYRTLLKKQIPLRRLLFYANHA